MKKSILFLSVLSLCISSMYGQYYNSFPANGDVIIKGSNSDLWIKNTSESESGIIFKDNEDGSGYQQAKIMFNSNTTADNKLNFYMGNNQSTPRMTIAYNGNIGLGTLNPGKNLEIFSTSKPAIRLKYNLSNPDRYSIWDIVNLEYNLAIYYDEHIYDFGESESMVKKFEFTSTGSFHANSVRAGKFSDLSNGNYYLCPANTDISLKVAGRIQTCGKIEAEEIEVKEVCAAKINVDMSNVADYVFEEGYNLPSLNEVKKFVLENKHLPGIPAGKELEKNGMNVAEMNNMLLQKIEELTLYIIDQEKRINELEMNIKD